MKKFVAVAALAATIPFAVAGCSTGIFDFFSAGTETTASPVSPTPTPKFDQPFDANDVMFAQMMIVHHEQAVEMSELALTNTTNAEILDLAHRILDTQQPEIDTMNAWLESAGATGHMHSMDMPGLADADTMNLLRDTTDLSFDSMFLMTMIQHHEGAISMANDVLATTSNEDVRTLANSIVSAQTSEIDDMYTLLGP